VQVPGGGLTPRARRPGRSAKRRRLTCAPRLRAQASDVFAFGVLLVSMLTGEAPWAGRSGPQIVLAAGIMRLRPLPPPHAPPHLAALIDRCLKPEPAERPTIESAAAVIGKLLAGSRRASQ